MRWLHIVPRRHVSSFKSTAALKKPVFDLKSILSNTQAYEESLKRRAAKNAHDLRYIIENRQVELDLSNDINALKHERTKLGESMKSAHANASMESTSGVDHIKARLSQIKDEIKTLESKHDALASQLYASVESLPNLLHPTVPEDPHEGEIVEFINGASEEEIVSRIPKTKLDHKQIGEKLGILEFETASRISGSSWYYLIGDGALLEQALVQYGLSVARKNGYKMVAPPSIVKSEIVGACGFKPKDQNNEQQVYELTNSGLSLTGTAEIPLGALHSSSTISDTLPLKYVGVSRAYRAEAGARGKDTKGLYRVHEFTKVELFHFTTPDKSSGELEDLRQMQTLIILELGLAAKMINMPTTDLGAPAMKKYDAEAWMPGRGSWGELTSSSNCGDYQSRRLGIRYKDSDGKLKYVDTLNGTCMAVPRVIVAIVEQFYDPVTESIVIPEVLRPYMDGKDRITKA